MYWFIKPNTLCKQKQSKNKYTYFRKWCKWGASGDVEQSNYHTFDQVKLNNIEMLISKKIK